MIQLVLFVLQKEIVFFLMSTGNSKESYINCQQGTTKRYQLPGEEHGEALPVLATAAHQQGHPTAPHAPNHSQIRLRRWMHNRAHGHARDESTMTTINPR